MRIFKRKYNVVEGLKALKSEFSEPGDWNYINDMILYAEIGRDRKKLGPEWVERTREHLEGWRTERERVMNR